MNRLEAALIVFGLLFIIVFIVNYFVINKKYLNRISGKKKSKKKKLNEPMEISYLVGKFKLDRGNLNLNKLLFITALINALIISLVSVVVMLININVVLQLLIGFVLLISLIYSLYEILGRFLVKKGDKDEY